MGVSQRGEAGQVNGVGLLSGGLQLLEDLLHAHGVPDKDRVGEKCEGADLVHDLFVVAGTEGSLVGEEEPAGELVARLASAELELDAVS